MADLQVLDGTGATKWLKEASGDGSSSAPFVPQLSLTTGTATIGVTGIDPSKNTVVAGTGSATIGVVGVDPSKNTVVAGTGSATIGVAGIDPSKNTVVLGTGSATVGVVGIDPSKNTVQILSTDTIQVNIASATGSALGQATMGASVPVAIASDQSAFPITLNAATTGGYSTYSVIWPNNTTGVTIKTAAGELGAYNFGNSDTIDYWAKLYDKATAPTSADTPLLRIYLPNLGGSNLCTIPGVNFTTGLSLRVTGGIADNDTTTVTASKVTGNVNFK